MRLPLRPILALVAMFCGVGPAVPAFCARLEPLAAAEALPTSNPYRDALLRLERLSPEDRKALKEWAGHHEPNDPLPILTQPQQQLAADLATAVLAASSSPRTEARDWPLIADPDDPDNPAAITLLGVGSVRDLARIAAQSAASLPADAAADTYAAIAQLGRQQRAGRTLIEQLTGVAVEGIALAEASKRLNELSPDGLAKLAVAWSSLHPSPSNAEALAGERDAFFKPLLDKILVPGIRALLQDPTAGQAEAEEADTLSSDIRLSALMNLGDGDHRIVLENTRTHESFTLRPGAKVENFELVSLDFEKRFAIIRRGEQEAVVHLESKRIVPRKSPARHLREMCRFLDVGGDSEGEGSALGKILELVRKHPGGPEGYAKDLLAAYQAGIDHQLELAKSAEVRIEEEERPAAQDPLLAMAIPTFGRLARTLNNGPIFSAMLQAAIHHRLAELGEGDRVAAPSDPWSDKGEAFQMKTNEDGGLLLRSRYEYSPDALLTYKFAAPDAGFVRPLTH